MSVLTRNEKETFLSTDEPTFEEAAIGVAAINSIANREIFAVAVPVNEKLPVRVYTSRDRGRLVREFPEFSALSDRAPDCVLQRTARHIDKILSSLFASRIDRGVTRPELRFTPVRSERTLGQDAQPPPKNRLAERYLPPGVFTPNQASLTCSK